MMRTDTLAKLNSARSARKAAVIVTDLVTGEADFVAEEDITSSPFQEEIKKALHGGKVVTIEAGERRIFINPYLPPPKIVVIGAVHISQALAQMAPVAGYDLVVIDPRTAFATPERFGGVRLIAEWPHDVLPTEPLDSYTAVAAVTHDPKIDDFALSEALKAGCFYVGALGSRKTHAKRIERMKQMGHDEEEICRIAAPIGLDIGAASPAEIALATLAQIVQAFRRRHLSGIEPA